MSSQWRQSSGGLLARSVSGCLFGRRVGVLVAADPRRPDERIAQDLAMATLAYSLRGAVDERCSSEVMFVIGIRDAAFGAGHGAGIPPIQLVGDSIVETALAIDRFARGEVSCALCFTDIAELLFAALGSVSLGLRVTSPQVTRLAQQATDIDRRRIATLHLLASVRSNASMARDMNVSVSTVKREIAELFRSFGVGSRAELVAYAVSAGLVAQTHRSGGGGDQ